MPDLEIHYDTEGGEWAALYVDGKLAQVGDSYHAEEMAFELAGIAVVHDNAFLLGQNTKHGCAQTVTEIEVYMEQRDARLTEAEQLEEQAASLLKQAEELRKQDNPDK